MFEDYKGYYAVLGLQPNATQALIKAAYRVRAMELHPDRNTSSSATAQTQLLNEAYQILGDEELRRQYDMSCNRGSQTAQSSTSDTAEDNQRSATTTGANNSSSSESVNCSFCKAVTLQPRYREVATIFSYLIGSHKFLRRGIYCSSCERKYSAFGTGITSIFGWWSVYGFFWTVEALYKNLTGSWRFASQDAMLSCAQAFYFAGKGNIELAHAVALDAQKLASRRQYLSREQRRRVGLGYESQDKLNEIRSALVNLIDQTRHAAGRKELVRQPLFRQPSFLVQAGIISALLISVMLTGISIQAENHRLELARVRAEQSRLEREGIAKANALAIAEAEDAKLRQLARPTPQSGRFDSSLPSLRFNSPVGLPGLRIHATTEANVFIKLSDWTSGAPAFSIFVRAGETVDVKVPFGTYRVRMASGKTWYGEKIRFGPDTTYTQIDESLTFSIDGDRLSGHELQLSRVRNGNLHPSSINPDQF